eukprot:5203835-Alexandrium_andersonii.AAC.1
MSASLVGSEMCIRDRPPQPPRPPALLHMPPLLLRSPRPRHRREPELLPLSGRSELPLQPLPRFPRPHPPSL